MLGFNSGEVSEGHEWFGIRVLRLVWRRLLHAGVWGDCQDREVKSTRAVQVDSLSQLKVGGRAQFAVIVGYKFCVCGSAAD